MSYLTCHDITVCDDGGNFAKEPPSRSIEDAASKVNLEVGAALGHVTQSCYLVASVLDILLTTKCDFRLSFGDIY